MLWNLPFKVKGDSRSRMYIEHRTPFQPISLFVQIVLQLYKQYCNRTKCTAIVQIALHLSNCIAMSVHWTLPPAHKVSCELKRSMDQAPGKSCAHMDLIGNEMMFFIQIICIIRLSNGKWWSMLCILCVIFWQRLVWRSMKKIQCWFYCKLNIKKNTCHDIICAILE